MKTLTILLMAATAYGSTAWENSLADAIYKTEGGAKTAYAYGVKARYTHTTPRQACLNTIQHQVRRWNAQEHPKPFIAFIADSYCPKSADPIGHDNWIRNTSYFMKQSNQPLNPL